MRASCSTPAGGERSDGSRFERCPSWRPRRGRIVAYGIAAVIVVGMIVVAIALPGGSRGFRTVDRIGLVLFGLVAAWFLHCPRPSSYQRGRDGVTVVSLFRRRRLEWAEIVGVNLREAIRGSPRPRRRQRASRDGHPGRRWRARPGHGPSCAPSCRRVRKRLATTSACERRSG